MSRDVLMKRLGDYEERNIIFFLSFFFSAVNECLVPVLGLRSPPGMCL